MCPTSASRLCCRLDSSHKVRKAKFQRDGLGDPCWAGCAVLSHNSKARLNTGMGTITSHLPKLSSTQFNRKEEAEPEVRKIYSLSFQVEFLKAALFLVSELMLGMNSQLDSQVNSLPLVSLTRFQLMHKNNRSAHYVK